MRPCVRDLIQEARSFASEQEDTRFTQCVAPLVDAIEVLADEVDRLMAEVGAQARHQHPELGS